MGLIDKLTAIGNAIRAKNGTTEKLSLDQMPVEISNIRTGVELDFEVVPNPKPENPKTNTIWVNTDNITGCFFSADEPEKVDGLVWFAVGSASPVAFNAVKDNGIMVYPLSAQQCINGAWVAKTARSYQNGAWVEWIEKLYSYGDECTAITGGWTLTNASGGTSKKNADHVYFSYSGSNSIQSYFHTSDKISFPYRGYKTLKAKLDITSHFSSSVFGLATAKQAERNEFAFSTTFDTTGNGVVVSVDISNANGDFYVSLYSSMKTSKLYEYWFE